MNRNVESHFSMNPHLSIPRSKMDRSCEIKTTANVGEIVPFFLEEVLPGDTFDIKTSKVIRLQTMLTPIYDNIYCDTYYFFVPNRLVWDHWKEFNGENTESAWIPSTTYTIPQITSPSGGWSVGSIADYFGIRTGVENLSVSALPFRAYALIMDEWFRDQNLTSPLSIPKSDATVQGSNGSNYIVDVSKGGKPFKASKFHDAFTSALPGPQKGTDVTIPLGVDKDLPVYALNKSVPGSSSSSAGSNFYPLKLGSFNTSFLPNTMGYLDSSRNMKISGQAVADIPPMDQPFLSGSYGFTPMNLWARNSDPVMATINQLRMAFQIQRLFEKDAIGGTRYTEILRTHFGVTSPDARLQRPEYLGGNRIPLTINQIVQQSETGTTPQGTPVGLSLSSDSHADFVRSFTEHGHIIGLVVLRYDHSYQQGIPKAFSRQTRFDYYWPALANLGNQAIKNKEIFAQGSSVVNSATNIPYDEEVFGYQEAWYEYRYKPNMITGEMRSDYELSLDKWHLGDYYSELPRLSDSWIREDKNNVDRVLAVTSEVSNQAFMDIYVRNYATRPMPVYSIPGLIDHN